MKPTKKTIVFDLKDGYYTIITFKQFNLFILN